MFGAGHVGRKTLTGLRKAGIEPLAFIDNDARLWNTSVEGVEVLSPEEAARRHGDQATFVITIWRGEGYRSDGTARSAAAQFGLQVRGHVPAAVLEARGGLPAALRRRSAAQGASTGG